MQLKIMERAGQREWVVVLDDQEMYEQLCNAVAWSSIKGGKIKAPEELVSEIEVITVHIVDRATEPESGKHIQEIKNAFIKAVLSEINRLGIELPG